MRRVHHLALGARDITSLAEFYVRVFGLSVVQTNQHDDGSVRSIWLDLDPGVLMIEESGHETRMVKGRGSGLFLIAFEVNEGERESLAEQIVSHGGTVESHSVYSSYGRDPEGNRIAISSYPLPRSQ
jgi:catechol-2,3-dioxygenase